MTTDLKFPMRPRLTVAEERELFARWHNQGDIRAFDEIIASCTGIVLATVREIRVRGGTTSEDLIQEGLAGLVLAARRFDPSRGVRFFIYATKYIRAYVIEHTMQTRGALRIGRTRADRRVYFRLGRLWKQFGKDAPASVYAAALEMSEAQFREAAERVAWSQVSMGTPLRVDDTRTIESSLTAEAPSAEEMLGDRQEHVEQLAAVKRAMRNLLPRDRAILRARRLQEDPPTFKELAKQHGVSVQRAQQLETRALRKIREAVTG